MALYKAFITFPSILSPLLLRITITVTTSRILTYCRSHHTLRVPPLPEHLHLHLQQQEQEQEQEQDCLLIPGIEVDPDLLRICQKIKVVGSERTTTMKAKARDGTVPRLMDMMRANEVVVEVEVEMIGQEIGVEVK
jgi:hypothetical protein